MKGIQRNNNKKTSMPSKKEIIKKGDSFLSKLLKDYPNQQSDKDIESMFDDLDSIKSVKFKTNNSQIKTLKKKVKIDNNNLNNDETNYDIESDIEYDFDYNITNIDIDKKCKLISDTISDVELDYETGDEVDEVDEVEQTNGINNKMKVCKKCKLNKPIEQFSKHSSTADKLDNRCKQCVKEMKTALKSKIIKDNEGKTTRDIVRSASKYIDIFEPDLSHTNWQGGKTIGTYFKRDGDTKYTVVYQNKSKIVETEKEAKDFLMKENILHDTCKNRYKIITFNNKKYVIMQLGENYVSLFSYQDLDYLRKVKIFRTKSSTNINSKYYVGVCINYINKLIHNVITNFDMCDHLDRCPLDNRRENISYTDHSDNNKNKTCISYKKIKTNDDKIVANIKWIDNTERGFVEKNETHDCKNMDEARLWLETRSAEIEKFTKHDLDSDFLKLKKEYIEIMSKHAPEYKYLDDIIIEDDNKDEKIKIIQLNKDKNLELKKLKLNTNDDKKLDKTSKYNLFKNIDKDFSFDKYNINIKDNTIQHLTYLNKEYKFCGHCIKWCDINLFGASNSTPDKYSKTCKTCKNEDKEHKREIKRLWVAKNKEKVTEYNKAYKKEHKISYNN
jgi:hypothetical protein